MPGQYRKHTSSSSRNCYKQGGKYVSAAFLDGSSDMTVERLTFLGTTGVHEFADLINQNVFVAVFSKQPGISIIYKILV